MECPACGADNPSGARFCTHCGRALTPDSAPVPGPDLRERRIVTVLFADISGSTALAEQVDPETWSEVMAGAFPILNQAVARYDGTVARLLGDAILAVFGAPEAHEDDPERAVRAGLDLLGDMEPYRVATLERLRREGGVAGHDDFLVRVGINTGEVVVGDVGSDVRSEYTVLGDAVNLAARMEQTAQPGTIQVTATTAAAVSAVFELEPVGPLTVEGKREPIHAFRVLGPLARRRARGSDQATPLTGREDERARLWAAVEGVAAGRSGIVFLLGEAGLGKSRLIEDLHERATRAGVAWFGATCLSFEATMAFATARKLLVDVAGPAGLAAALAQVDAHRRTRLTAALESLVGGGAAGSGETDLERIRQDTHDGAAELLAAVTGGSPAIVAVDDLHWADAASVDLLAWLFSLTDRLPLVFLCASRPDRAGRGWHLKQHAESEYPHRTSLVTLAPLSSEQTAHLVESLTARSSLPPAVVTALAQRAEGNPFYAEELVRDVAQSGLPEGAAVEAARLPGSVRMLLRARIDRLDPAARQVLEAAAVVGRSFDRAVLDRIAPVDDLGRRLGELLRVGLVIEEGGVGEGRYAFRHGLTQEAAYGAILRSRRRLLHREVGEILAKTNGDEASAAPVLAHHFELAGDHGRAAGYRLVAGQAAARMAALTDAIAHFDAGLAGVDVDVETLIRLRLGRGAARDAGGDFGGALDDLRQALDDAVGAGDRELEWRATVALGELWASRDYSETGQLYRAALRLAHSIGDDHLIGTSLNRLGNWHANADRPSTAVSMHREALGIFRRLDSVPDIASSLDLLAMASALGGSMEEARAHYTEALELFRRLGDRPALISVLTSASLAAPSYEGLAAPAVLPARDALASLEEALGLALEIGSRSGEAYVRFIRSQVLACTGALGDGLAEARAAVSVAREIGHRQWEAAGLLSLAGVEHDMLDVDSATGHISEACTIAAELGSTNWLIIMEGSRALFAEDDDPSLLEERLDGALSLPWAGEFQGHDLCILAKAELQRRQGRAEAALETLQVFPGSGSEGAIPTVALVRGRALAEAGQADEAAAELEGGLRAAYEQDLPGRAWRLHAALADLDVPGAHRAEADALIERLAATLPPDLRTPMTESYRLRTGHPAA